MRRPHQRAVTQRGRLARRAAAGAALTAAALASVVPAASAASGGPDPSRFAARVDNPWFPLVPGTVLVYRGTKDGLDARDVVTVTRLTTRIQGVRCTVVRDRLYLGGRLAERTTDWYAQDRSGNVWYFGEMTAELDEQGRVESTEGTWRAGRDGARAGVFMPARPKAGHTGQQERYAGHAEDRYRIVSLHAAVSVPAASSRSALLVEEWTRLEPGVLDRKLYVRGLGLALERSVKGGDEHLRLVSVARP